MHLTNDELLHLATLVVEDLPFTEEDVRQMQHIGECEECYAQLQSYMAVLAAVEAGEYGKPVDTGLSKATETHATAIIRIVIVNAKAMLEQLNAAQSDWIFEAAIASAGKRSLDSEDTAIARLEDIENSETFVAYNEDTKELTIQIDCRSAIVPTRVYIRYSSGDVQDVSLERCEYLLRATIKNIADSNFEIVLEK